jgi:hypothetical protein
MNTEWHFPIMIVASLFIFFVIIRIVLAKNDFNKKRKQIFILAMIVVVFGMLFGKYGATYGLPWWLYYPVPMLITVILPPVILKLKARKTIIYLILSFLSAPFIHAVFSFFLGWTEYMPFWKIPFIGNLT